MAELLIKAISATHADPTKDRRGCYKRGDPVVVMPDGHTWGREEGPPKFVILKVPGTTVAAVQQYIAHWQRKISYNIVASNLALDGFRIDVTANVFNASSGEGKITRAMVETFLNNWGASVVSAGDNTVRFDIAILDALKSTRFWDAPVGQVVFTEQSYTQATGVHRLSINYSALAALEPATAAAKVQRRHGSIVSHDHGAKVLVADFTRADVRNEFQDDVKSKVEDVLCRRQFSLTGAMMTSIEAAGGTLTVTAQQAQAALQDRTSVVL